MSRRSSFACWALSGGAVGWHERANRVRVRLPGRNGDELLLGPAQGRELAAEHAAGIDVDRAIEPFGLRHGRVAIDHAGTSAVLGRPVVADGQPELVGLARRFAEQREVPHLGRPAPLHLRLHAGVRDDEPAVVEDVVADEAVQKLLHVGAELRRLLFEFRQRPVEPVRDGDVAPFELPLQLDVVVAGHAEGGAGLRHRHHRLQGVDDAWPAVHEVADEDGLSACRVCPRTAVVPLVPELLQQLFELVAAAVHVADDVERPGLALAVVPERLPLDDGRIDFFLRLEHVDVAKAFASEAAQRTMQLAPLVPNDVRAEVAVRPRTIAFVADAFRQSR